MIYHSEESIKRVPEFPHIHKVYNPADHPNDEVPFAKSECWSGTTIKDSTKISIHGLVLV